MHRDDLSVRVNDSSLLCKRIDGLIVGFTRTMPFVSVGLLGPPLNGKGNESVVRARQDRLLNDLTIFIDVVDVEVRQANLLAPETH